MRVHPLRRTTTAALGLTLAATAVLAGPAGAADVDATVTVEAAGAEALFITQAAATTVALETPSGVNAAYSTADQPVSANLHQTTVTDARGTLLGGIWSVTVTGSALTYQGTDVPTGETAPSIPAANAMVYVDALDNLIAGTVASALTGTTVVGGVDALDTTNNLSGPYVLIEGTTLALTPEATAVYTPAMQVTIPGGTPAGTYGTTVTQTVS